MMTASQRYVYSALLPKHIRILVLEPSFDRDAPLHFSFFAGDLEELRSRYEAVSYTCGEPKLEFPLHHEDGSCVFVTENLDVALRRLRHRLDARWLWADAVCMDQTNTEEKAVQIPLMDKIYRGAKRVLAWLGPGDGQDEAGMQLLGRLLQLPKSDVRFNRKGFRWVRDLDTITTPFKMSDLVKLRKHGAPILPLLDDRGSNRIETLLSLPWFRRFWTIQECVLNIDVILFCGGSEISLTRLSVGLQIYKNYTRNTSEEGFSPGLRAIGQTTDLWKRYSIGNSDAVTSDTEDLDILDLVDQFPEHDCSDHRDRIYSLYALASNINPKTLLNGRKVDATN